MKSVIGLTLITAFLITACAPGGGGGAASVSDTQKFSEPIVHEAGKYQVYEGLTEAQDLKVAWEAGTKKYSLKGKLSLRPVLSGELIDVELDLNGTPDENGNLILKPSSSLGVEGMQLAAKATCLGVNNDCGNSYVDIYVAYQEKIYHHQIESLAEIVPDPEDPADGSLEQHDDDFHEDSDVAEPAPGGYSVDLEGDIDKALELKLPPQQPTKPEPGEQEQPKQEKPKQEEPKKEEPKAEEPKKDEPKKEEPKKDPPKVNPPKKDEPKKEKPKTVPKPKPAPKPQEEKPEDQPAPLPAEFPRFANQAIGTVNNGRLQNGIDLWAYEKSMETPGFTVMRPERRTHFATTELAYLIAKMGSYSKLIAPSHELHIGDISRKSGGPLGSHKSHENGMDADIAFYFKADKAMTSFSTALKNNRQPVGDWMMAQQWKLFKYAVSTKYVDLIFIHPTLKQSLCRYAVSSGEYKAGLKSGDAFETLRRLWPDRGHDDHFHLRIKRACAKGQKGCLKSNDPAPKTGC